VATWQPRVYLSKPWQLDSSSEQSLDNTILHSLLLSSLCITVLLVGDVSGPLNNPLLLANTATRVRQLRRRKYGEIRVINIPAQRRRVGKSEGSDIDGKHQGSESIRKFACYASMTALFRHEFLRMRPGRGASASRV
jgi:hypothetical protein